MKCFDIIDKKAIANTQIKIYLPDDYFKNGISEDFGNKIITLGIFYMFVFNKFHLFKLPIDIEIPYTRIEKEKITIEKNEESFKVLYLEKGDVFLESCDVIENFKSTYKFVTLLHGGKMPTNIGYSNIVPLYHENLMINKINLGVPSFTLEMIVSELSRNPKNRNIPFRKTEKRNDKNFSFTNIKEIPHLKSTFESVTFEDLNKSLTLSSLRAAKDTVDGTESPLEKILKY